MGYVIYEDILTDVHKVLIEKFSYEVVNYIRGAYDKFPDFFRMGTFIERTHMKLDSPSK